MDRKTRVLNHATLQRIASLQYARQRKAVGGNPEPAVCAAKHWHREVLRAKGVRVQGYVWI